MGLVQDSEFSHTGVKIRESFIIEMSSKKTTQVTSEVPKLL